MAFAALLTCPFGIGATHTLVSHPSLFARLLLVGVMRRCWDLDIEMQALRHLKTLHRECALSARSGVAFLIGWLLLHERVTAWTWWTGLRGAPRALALLRRRQRDIKRLCRLTGMATPKSFAIRTFAVR